MIALRTLVLAAAIPFILVACQTMPYQPYARNVLVKPGQSGVIALKGEHRDEDREKALSMIASNCSNKPYTITEEGETVVGQKTVSSADETHQEGNRQQVGTLWGMPVTSGSGPSKNTQTSATTENVREWQIKYECHGAEDVAKTTAPASKTKKRQ